MKKFLTMFFVGLGVIFFIILLALAYLWFADPFEIRPLLERYQAPAAAQKEVGVDESSNNVESGAVVDQNPNLTPAQEDALTLIGIDPAGLPEEISKAQMECFVRVLGEVRVAEIQAGAAPTPIELLKAKDCL